MYSNINHIVKYKQSSFKFESPDLELHYLIPYEGTVEGLDTYFEFCKIEQLSTWRVDIL